MWNRDDDVLTGGWPSHDLSHDLVAGRWATDLREFRVYHTMTEYETVEYLWGSGGLQSFYRKGDLIYAYSQGESARLVL